MSVEAKETPQRPQQEGEVKLRFAQDYSELLAYLNTFSVTRVRAGGVVVEAVEAEVMEEAAAIDRCCKICVKQRDRCGLLQN